MLIAAVFIFSAVSKLMPSAIDQFELYIYSFGFFSLDFCFIVARLCIGVELVLALFTLCGWFPRAMRLATSGVLIVFSLFLCYASLIGRNDNCQCFGEMVDLNPLQSLLKNALLLAVVLFYYHLTPPKPRMQSRWVAIPVVLAAVLMATPFIVSIPDSWYFGPEKQSFNEEAFTEWYSDYTNNQAVEQADARRIVAFVTPKCPYCQLARKKLDAIVSRHDIDPSRLIYVEPQRKENTQEAIVVSSKLFNEIIYDRTTKSYAFPLVLLLDGTQVVATYHLRNIDEDQIVEFFKYNT